MEVLFILFGSAFVFSLVYMVFVQNLHRIFTLIGGTLIQGTLYYLFSNRKISCDAHGLGEFIGSTIVVAFPLLIALIIHILIAVRNIFRKTPNELYLIVQEEIESEQLDKPLWAEAFCRASGDKEKAKQIYIKLRLKNYK